MPMGGLRIHSYKAVMFVVHPCLSLQIIYKEYGGSLMYLNVLGNDSRSGILTDLKGYTVYTITVLAYTRVGDGAIGNEVPVQTLEWGESNTNTHTHLPFMLTVYSPCTMGQIF